MTYKELQEMPKIQSWRISVTVGYRDLNITDVPNHVATVVDEWLTELEEQKNNE
tara:strand:+ start:2739 stop:2900 length:162 start_codon:yes stop_codon:yes gene_type:complete